MIGPVNILKKKKKTKDIKPKKQKKTKKKKKIKNQIMPKSYFVRIKKRFK